MKDFIIFLGRPRTGSSYLTEIAKLSGIFESRGEIFNRTMAHNITADELSAIADRAPTVNITTQENNLLRKTPIEAIDYLSEKADERGKILCFKVFPGHLENQQLMTILDRPEAHVIVLDRSILESYLSLMKAQKIKKWDRADTSEVKIKFDGNHFNHWFRNQISWYETIQKSSDIMAESLIYKDFTQGSDPENLEYVLRVIERTGIDVSNATRNIASTRHKKQDQSKPSDTVLNYEFMINAPGIYATKGGSQCFLDVIKENKQS